MSTASSRPLLQLTSPLGDDSLPFQEGVLHAVDLHAQERISQPFQLSLSVVSTTRSIDPSELLFQPIGLTIHKQPNPDRFFNGVIRCMSAVGQAQRSRWMYSLEVVPRLWFLSQTEDCRIFQNKTAQAILEIIFTEHSIHNVDFRIYGEQPLREYTTQYNETDLMFIHRLMEESGWFYIFEHTKNSHTLVVTDRNQSFKLTSNPPHWVIHEGNNIDVFDQWGESHATAYGEVKLQDYDPTRPAAPIVGYERTVSPTPGALTRDVFNWPAFTTDDKVAHARARFRVENGEVTSSVCKGHGYDQNFMPGLRFILAKDPFTEEESKDYALNSVDHYASDHTWIAGSKLPNYENNFSCFLQKTPWREPARNTRPSMTGIFSAIVIGDDGEEIHADTLGRVKVRLMFDRRKETRASMAIWVRVISPWSGNRWGWQHLPRVGTEVAISFMNGDPDTPVVLGSFYNRDQMPVFEVPRQQTRQGFRSRSTLQGGTQDYSELSFDDKKDEELVFLHAQKNYNVEVEKDQTVTVGQDQTAIVYRNSSLLSKAGNVSIETGAGNVEIRSQGDVRVRSENGLIELRADDENYIRIDRAGITIKGHLVKIN